MCTCDLGQRQAPEVGRVREGASRLNSPAAGTLSLVVGDVSKASESIESGVPIDNPSKAVTRTFGPNKAVSALHQSAGRSDGLRPGKNAPRRVL